MARFAADTSVPVDRTLSEIERLIYKYGAKQFARAHDEGEAHLAFTMRTRQIRFTLKIPSPAERRFTHKKNSRGGYGSPRTSASAHKAWEQGCRSIWRALLLIIKAKLEAVESGISVFDVEFLPYIVVAGQTVGDQLVPDLDRIIAANKSLLALPAPTEVVDVQ